MNASTDQPAPSVSRLPGLRSELLRGTIGVGGLRFSSLCLQFGTSVLLARFLGPQGYGQYAFVMAAVSMLALPVAPGMMQLVTREVAIYGHSEAFGLLRGLLRWSQRILLALCVAIAGVLVPITILLGRGELTAKWTLLSIGLIMLPLLGLTSVRTGAARGLGRVVLAQLPEMLVRPATQVALVVALLALGLLSPASAVSAGPVAAAVALLVSVWIFSRVRPREISSHPPESSSRTWLRAWGPFTLLTAASVLNGQIGVLLLGLLGTNTQTAALRIADQGALTIAFSLNVINMVIAPQVIRAHKDRDNRRLQGLSTQSARLALSIALPIAIPLVLLAEPLIRLLFGAAYMESASLPLIILSIGQLTSASLGSVALILTMCGHEQESLRNQLIALGVNGSLATLLIPELGAVGAAYAALAGMLTWNLLLAISAWKRLKLRVSIF